MTKQNLRTKFEICCVFFSKQLKLFASQQHFFSFQKTTKKKVKNKIKLPKLNFNSMKNNFF